MIAEDLTNDLEYAKTETTPSIHFEPKNTLKIENNDTNDKIYLDQPPKSVADTATQMKKADSSVSKSNTALVSAHQELPIYRGTSVPGELYIASHNSDSTESVTFGTMKQWLLTNLDLDLEEQTADEIAATLWSSSIGPERISAILTQKRKKLEQALALYISRYNFSGLTLDKALRHLSATFVLAGESQQVERVLHAFATEYYRQNTAVFESIDLVFLLANAIVILNTDLYNPSNKNKMTKRQFVENVEKAIRAQYYGAGKEDSIQYLNPDAATQEKTIPLPISMLKDMYKSVKAHQIRLPASVPSNLLDLHRTASTQSSLASLSISSSGSSYLWSTPSLLGSPTESSGRNSALSNQSNHLPSSLLSVDGDSTNSPPLQITHQGLLARKRLFDKVNKRSRDRSWHHYYTILDNSELYFYKPFLMPSMSDNFENAKSDQRYSSNQQIKEKESSKPLSLKKSVIKDLANVDCIVLRHAVAKAYSEGSFEKYSSTGKGKPTISQASSAHFLWILLIPGGCQILFRTSTDASRMEWIQAVNRAAALQTIPPLPCPIGSDYRLLYVIPNLSLSRSNLSLSSQIALLERKIKEIDDSIGKLVSTHVTSSPLSQSITKQSDHSSNIFSFSNERKGKPCLQSKMNFLNWELQKYHIYLSALQRDTPHFLTMPPSYLGQRNHLYIDK